MIGEIVDRVARDRFGDHPVGFAHRHIADDDEGRAGRGRKRLQPRRARAGAEHDHAPLERLAAERLAEQDAQADEHDRGKAHRIQQVRSPESQLRQQEEYQAEEDRAERHRDEQPRRRDAQRLQGIGAVNAHRDHRQLHAQHEARQLRDASGDRLDQHADLPGPDRPAEFGRDHQQHDVEQPEQQHGVRHIMFEQPDHRRWRFPLDVNNSDTLAAVAEIDK